MDLPELCLGIDPGRRSLPYSDLESAGSGFDICRPTGDLTQPYASVGGRDRGVAARILDRDLAVGRGTVGGSRRDFRCQSSANLSQPCAMAQGPGPAGG